MTSRLLAIYLQDHLAGASGGLELAKRAARSNEGTPLGDFLDRLAGEIAEDRETLVEIMAALEIGADRVKNALGWGAEKLGRLKPNGQLTGYSPLSRLVELEGLHVGVSGKLSAFQSLRATFGEEVAGRNLDGLISRATRQLEELAEHRAEAARVAFEDETAPVA
ncbi:MAG TPA: hypothetical protein VFY99_02575 [Solirubrobacterales bacterium]